MITDLIIKDSPAVPYLMGSTLMQTHPEGKIDLSLDKPNLLLGPNGSGKSALMKMLALRFLAYTTGFSAFDDAYVSSLGEINGLWGRENSWGQNWRYMPGVKCSTDEAPAVYFRPGMIPGDNTSLTHAMMCGYMDLAREVAHCVDNKSSGQGNQAMLEYAVAVMRGKAKLDKYQMQNWSHGDAPRDLKKDKGWVSDGHWQAETLKKKFGISAAPKMPVVLLDEPEQSLDVHAQMRLWSAIKDAPAHGVQVIVATHSPLPLLEPERYNFIETEPGYLAIANNLLNA